MIKKGGGLVAFGDGRTAGARSVRVLGSSKEPGMIFPGFHRPGREEEHLRF